MASPPAPREQRYRARRAWFFSPSAIPSSARPRPTSSISAMPPSPRALYDFVALTVRAVPGHGGWLGSGSRHPRPRTFLAPRHPAPGDRHFRAPVCCATIRSLRSLAARSRSASGARPRSSRRIFCSASTTPATGSLASVRVPRAGLGHRRRRKCPNPLFRIANGVIAMALIAQFLAPVPYPLLHHVAVRRRHPARWPAACATICAASPPDSVSVSATWYMTPALEYYRNIYRHRRAQTGGAPRSDPASTATITTS